MQLRSTNATHKLFITVVLLVLFAIPFATQWARVKAVDTHTLLAAGGAVVGSHSDDSVTVSEPTNHAGKAMSVSGKSFLGVSAQ